MVELIDRIGEVVEATSTGFIAQGYKLYQIPPLGSLVKTRNILELYGVAYYAATTSIDPGRRVVARGKDEMSEEAVYQASPQLLKLIKSEFSVLVVGHKLDGKINHYLSPNPVRIHSFVYQCSPQEIRDFSQSFGFLSLLVSARLPVSMDELVSACLRQMSQSHEDSRRFLVEAGKELAELLHGEYSQLRSILRKLKE
jgi:hypothetical protein